MHTHRSTLMSRYTLQTCTLNWMNTDPELKAHAHPNKYKNTSLRLKDRLSTIITPAQRRLAFGLKDSSLFFFLFFFWQGDRRGVWGGELNGISSPWGTQQRQSSVEISDSCFYHPR